MSGSVSVVRQLLAAGLLDELHLLVHPIAVRKGMRLFDEGEAPIPLTLISSETFETGVLNLVYAPPSRPATPATRRPRPTCHSPSRSRATAPGPAKLRRRDVEWGDAVGDGRGFASVGRVELAEDVRDVDAGGLDADHELARDLAVGVAAGDERQDLGLARRQAEGVGEALLRVGRGRFG